MNRDDFPAIDTGLIADAQPTIQAPNLVWAEPKSAACAQPATPPAPAAVPAAPEIDWSSMRKLNPADVLFAPTRDWAASLPADVAPHALLARYPRIANMLARQWHDAGACRDYLYDLLVDRRGGRRGFPVDVRKELLVLRVFFDDLHPELR